MRRLYIGMTLGIVAVIEASSVTRLNETGHLAGAIFLIGLASMTAISGYCIGAIGTMDVIDEEVK